MNGSITAPVANGARVWDAFSNGRHSQAVDRGVAYRLRVTMGPLVKEHNEYRNRLVKTLTGTWGISQILDLGAGMPARDGTHPVAAAQAGCRHLRAVLVDDDQLVIQGLHAATAHLSDAFAKCVCADVRSAHDVLEQAASVLDLACPVGLVATAILDYVPDSDARDLLKVYGDKLAPDSYFVGSYASEDLKEVAAVWNGRVTPQMHPRTDATVKDMIRDAGFTLIAAGEPVSRWYPTARPERCRTVGQRAFIAVKS